MAIGVRNYRSYAKRFKGGIYIELVCRLAITINHYNFDKNMLCLIILSNCRKKCTFLFYVDLIISHKIHMILISYLAG